MLGASRSSLGTARARLSQLAAQSGADLDALATDLLAVAGLLVRELPLRRALADPSTAEEAKASLVQALLGDRVGAPALGFVKELVASRWSRPSDLADALETLAVLASFEQALAEGTLDTVEDDLFRFARIVEREAALREALEDTFADDSRKRALLEGLLAGKVGPVSLRVITAAALVSVRRRNVHDALEQFSRLAAELRERLNARVTVAVEPTPEQLERLGEGLARVFGKKMGLRVEVDPQILGGVVVRVGDEVLDGSLARRLDIARRGLAQTG